MHLYSDIPTGNPMNDKIKWAYLLMLKTDSIPKISWEFYQEVFNWLSSMENPNKKVQWFGVIEKAIKKTTDV
jgi:hypothetical protein